MMLALEFIDPEFTNTYDANESGIAKWSKMCILLIVSLMLGPQHTENDNFPSIYICFVSSCFEFVFTYS